MYKRIDFSQLEGYPLDQDALDHLQKSFRDTFAGISLFFGDYVYISGVADLGANYGDGWVAINGEILKFVGGLKAAQIVIEETSVPQEFNDGTTKNVEITRVAKSGSAGGVNHSGFVRLKSIKQIMADILAEVGGREGGDNVLEAAIIAEVAARGTAISTEATARVNGDNAEAMARANGDSTEATARNNQFDSCTLRKYTSTSWNMDVNPSKGLTIAGLDLTKIVTYSATVIDNSGAVKISLGQGGTYETSITAVQVGADVLFQMGRPNSGYFDGAGWNNAFVKLLIVTEP